MPTWWEAVESLSARISALEKERPSPPTATPAPSPQVGDLVRWRDKIGVVRRTEGHPDYPSLPYGVQFVPPFAGHDFDHVGPPVKGTGLWCAGDELEVFPRLD